MLLEVPKVYVNAEKNSKLAIEVYSKSG